MVFQRKFGLFSLIAAVWLPGSAWELYLLHVLPVFFLSRSSAQGQGGQRRGEATNPVHSKVERQSRGTSDFATCEGVEICFVKLKEPGKLKVRSHTPMA